MTALAVSPDLVTARQLPSLTFGSLGGALSTSRVFVKDVQLWAVVVDPTDGVLYTANNRIAELEQSRLLGHEWGSPDRAARIDELLGDRVDLDADAAEDVGERHRLLHVHVEFDHVQEELNQVLILCVTSLHGE